MTMYRVPKRGSHYKMAWLSSNSGEALKE